MLVIGHDIHQQFRLFRHPLIKKLNSLKDSDPDLAKLLANQVCVLSVTNILVAFKEKDG